MPLRLCRLGRPARALGPLFGMLLALVAVPPAARADDPTRQFNPTFNPGLWSYGWSTTLGGTFTAFTTHTTDGNGIQHWSFAGNQSDISYNASGSPHAIGNNTTVQTGDLILFPGSTTQCAVLRWTAPAAGTYTVVARFIRRSTNSSAPAEVAVLQGSAVVYDRWVSNEMSGAVEMSAHLTLATSAIVDFVVGPGNGTNFSDAIALEASINPEPVPSVAGPVLMFGGQRFVVCRGDTAGESIAYDPINQRIASVDLIRNRCGTPVFATNMFAPGLAWDQRTSTYWQVTNARAVRNFTPSGVLVGTLFTVPLTFNVPGWGLDTLESVKGIATDSNFVYLVDAGDGGVQGTIRANEWFKFTRAGAPVTSSKLTNFHANLDLSPDCIVDDIVYVPFSSPIYPGKLLIPLEHSGIQVINTDGSFVAKFRWTDAGIPPGVKVSAFAGLTVDPANGNFYVVENDGSQSQIWTRLPQQGPTSYVIGVGSNQPRLQYPNPGCNRALWQALPASTISLMFGAAYRTVNSTVYGVNWGDGQLARFYPASGLGDRVVNTGATSLWGVAYDTERDLIYGLEQITGGSRILTIDPVTGASAPLSGYVGYGLEDIAYDSADHKIYSTTFTGGNPQLIRIDRDTGVGSIVGVTASCRGIDYDAVSGKLIAMNSFPSPAPLYNIDPATGAFTTLTTVPNATAWEGLAVVPVPAAPLLAVQPQVDVEASQLAISPNPSSDDAAIQFRLTVGEEVEAAVYDVTGRKVRSIARGQYSAGRHTLTWDGRDSDGRQVPSGVYFVRLDRGNRSLVARTVRVE